MILIGKIISAVMASVMLVFPFGNEQGEKKYVQKPLMLSKIVLTKF